MIQPNVVVICDLRTFRRCRNTPNSQMHGHGQGHGAGPARRGTGTARDGHGTARTGAPPAQSSLRSSAHAVSS